MGSHPRNALSNKGRVEGSMLQQFSGLIAMGHGPARLALLPSTRACKRKAQSLKRFRLPKRHRVRLLPP